MQQLSRNGGFPKSGRGKIAGPDRYVQFEGGDAVTGALVGEAVARLVSARAPGEGWGWRVDQPGNTECTALAAMALHAHRATSPLASAALREGVAWLRSRQHPAGSWPLGDQVPDASWTTGLAVLALADSQEGRDQALRGAEWLLARQSSGSPWLQRVLRRVFAAEPVVDQDPALVGWPWTDGTTAWVEPTAWSLLAVKMLRPHLDPARTAQRIEQAERLLVDRMCVGGGWNYGNKRVMGQALEPYPDTTALALLALQDRRSPAVTALSVARLGDMMKSQRTVLVLGCSVLALQLHGEDVSPLRAELRTRLRSPGADLDVRSLALALLALDEDTLPFRVSRHA
jgi:hypothetical protein